MELLDYDTAWKILDDFCKCEVQDELLRRAYYQILCKNVNSSAAHLSEIMKRAGNNHILLQQNAFLRLKN